MNNKLLQIWNDSSKEMPFDKDESNYAIEKEKLFARNSLVLDLGAAQGDDAIYFAKRGHKVILIDIADVALEKAKQKFKEEKLETKLIKLTQADLGEGKIPLGNEVIDVVYSRLSIHYFSRDITIALFKEIVRILKNNGSAFITLKSPDDEEEMNFLRKNAQEIEPGVFQEENGQIRTRYSFKQIKDVLYDAGVLQYVAQIGAYKEKLDGRKDKVKSGKTEFDLTEIVIKKS